MADGLRPCPLCGGEACVFDNGHGSYCVECCGCFTETRYYDTKAEAVKAWNTRAERTCRAESHDCGDGVIGLYCSECGNYIDENDNYCPACGAKVVE